LPLDLGEKPVLLDRFRREANLAAQLRHPNIVEIYECGEHNGFNYLAMEYVDGVDLHEYVLRKKQLDHKKARAIIIQAAKALEHLHKVGIVHRDIKPSNFLITKQDGRSLVKLIDLGLARKARDNESRPMGTTVGTVDFIAPEQARDAALADIRSDIYALGCTWYFLLAGHPPFPDGSLPQRISKHIEIEPADIRFINQGVTSSTVKVLTKMLAKNPEDRYQTPELLLRDLVPPKKKGRLAGRQRTTKRTFSGNGKVRGASRHWRRSKILWLAAAAIVLVVMILIIAPW
jgi:serine/threonine-protein kinase